jgi:hypothetical protein
MSGGLRRWIGPGIGMSTRLITNTSFRVTKRFSVQMVKCMIYSIQATAPPRSFLYHLGAVVRILLMPVMENLLAPRVETKDFRLLQLKASRVINTPVGHKHLLKLAYSAS